MFDDLTVDLVVARRRWSRIRRIRSAARSIRRSYPQIGFDVHRQDQVITIEFHTESAFFQWLLVWPANLPRWRRLSNGEAAEKIFQREAQRKIVCRDHR